MSADVAVFGSVYFDANALIYYVERDDTLQRKVAEIVVKALSVDARLFVSEIGIAECHYGAYRSDRKSVFGAYETLFTAPSIFEILPVDGTQLIAAAKLGAEKGLKLVDAVHFHVAVETSCDVFITNDRRFQSSHGITVLQLGDL
jgi:predicted nucleic acid-binding protein